MTFGQMVHFYQKFGSYYGQRLFIKFPELISILSLNIKCLIVSSFVADRRGVFVFVAIIWWKKSYCCSITCDKIRHKVSSTKFFIAVKWKPWQFPNARFAKVSHMQFAQVKQIKTLWLCVDAGVSLLFSRPLLLEAVHLSETGNWKIYYT